MTDDIDHSRAMIYKHTETPIRSYDDFVRWIWFIIDEVLKKTPTVHYASASIFFASDQTSRYVVFWGDFPMIEIATWYSGIRNSPNSPTFLVGRNGRKPGYYSITKSDGNGGSLIYHPSCTCHDEYKFGEPVDGDIIKHINLLEMLMKCFMVKSDKQGGIQWSHLIVPIGACGPAPEPAVIFLSGTDEKDAQNAINSLRNALTEALSLEVRCSGEVYKALMGAVNIFHPIVFYDMDEDNAQDLFYRIYRSSRHSQPEILNTDVKGYIDVKDKINYVDVPHWYFSKGNTELDISFEQSMLLCKVEMSASVKNTTYPFTPVIAVERIIKDRNIDAERSTSWNHILRFLLSGKMQTQGTDIVANKNKWMKMVIKAIENHLAWVGNGKVILNIFCHKNKENIEITDDFLKNKERNYNDVMFVCVTVPESQFLDNWKKNNKGEDTKPLYDIVNLANMSGKFYPFFSNDHDIYDILSAMPIKKVDEDGGVVLIMQGYKKCLFVYQNK